MGLIAEVVLLPFAPVRGSAWVVRQVLNEAERIYYDPATVRTVLAATLRFPLMSLRVSALIRLQGAKLWLRRLPVVPRPPHSNGGPS